VRGRILNRDKFESLYTFQDITDVHEQAQQLAVALKDAEAASEAKSYFLSTMSHELRTPLNGIMGVFQIMEWMDLSDKARDMVQTGKESSELLLAVLNDVLDFSRMAAGHLVLKPAPNDLYRCLASVNEMFAAMAQQRHIQLNFNLDPRLKATVVIDDVRLRQVLMNLVNNALKFTEAGSVRVQAQRLADQDARMQVQIDVIDTGIGMSEDTLGRLYQPFMQADQGNARTYQGTGLGLSIVHKLVQAMGGSIEVESTLGQGSHFTLRFNFELTQEQEQATPLAVTAHAERPTVAQIPPSGSTVVKTSPASQTAAASTAERPAPAPVAQTTSQVSAKLNVQSPLRGKQIAVIDDQQTNRVIARLMLQKAGATVHEFDDGSAFLRALRTPGTQFHAALMDLQMVPMDGLEATRLIRAERQASWRQLPIIAMTGKLMAEERQATLDAGMNGFLPKPMNYALMVETLCAALG
jgi:nitrogen-specific signal transduction histidine kinase/CheY-like chemotaxis protein